MPPKKAARNKSTPQAPKKPRRPLPPLLSDDENDLLEDHKESSSSSTTTSSPTSLVLDENVNLTQVIKDLPSYYTLNAISVDLSKITSAKELIHFLKEVAKYPSINQLTLINLRVEKSLHQRSIIEAIRTNPYITTLLVISQGNTSNLNIASLAKRLSTSRFLRNLEIQGFGILPAEAAKELCNLPRFNERIINLTIKNCVLGTDYYRLIDCFVELNRQKELASTRIESLVDDVDTFIITETAKLPQPQAIHSHSQIYESKREVKQAAQEILAPAATSRTKKRKADKDEDHQQEHRNFIPTSIKEKNIIQHPQTLPLSTAPSDEPDDEKAAAADAHHYQNITTALNTRPSNYAAITEAISQIHTLDLSALIGLADSTPHLVDAIEAGLNQSSTLHCFKFKGSISISPNRIPLLLSGEQEASIVTAAARCATVRKLEVALLNDRNNTFLVTMLCVTLEVLDPVSELRISYTDPKILNPIFRTASKIRNLKTLMVVKADRKAYDSFKWVDAPYHSLTSLMLDEDLIDEDNIDDFLRVLANLKNLTFLSFSLRLMPNAILFRVLDAIAQMPNLISLELDHFDISTDMLPKFYNALLANPCLLQLTIRTAPHYTFPIKPLAEKLQTHNSLKSLSIHDGTRKKLSSDEQGSLFDLARFNQNIIGLSFNDSDEISVATDIVTTLNSKALSKPQQTSEDNEAMNDALDKSENSEAINKALDKLEEGLAKLHLGKTDDKEKSPSSTGLEKQLKNFSFHEKQQHPAPVASSVKSSVPGFTSSS